MNINQGNRKSDQYATDKSNNALYIYYLLIEFTLSSILNLDEESDIDTEDIESELNELYNSDIKTAEQYKKAVERLHNLTKLIATQ